MSVSKSKDTDIHLRSESKTRARFLMLYALLFLLLIGLIAYFYYRSEEELMFSKQRILLMEYASEQSRKLKQLHRHFPRQSHYPRDERFQSAIYDLEYQEIFSTLRGEYLNLDEVIYSSGDYIHFVRVLDDYYLGAKYLIIEVAQNQNWYRTIVGTMLLYSMLSLVLLMLFGFYLSRLFVKPMRNSIMLLDRFIKDTTHELNTPLSAILANIETMEQESLSETNTKRLRRIEIGARTVSTLYEDLKFLTLERSKPIEDETFSLQGLMEGRLEYFSVLAKSKNLTILQSLNTVSITADKRLIARLIDNLLSNAIKYNRRGGTIEVCLEEGELSISDSGVGIETERLHQIFDRYSRFNESEGGFGIGLSIVKRIVDHYGFEITVESRPKQGTKVVVLW